MRHHEPQDIVLRKLADIYHTINLFFKLFLEKRRLTMEHELHDHVDRIASCTDSEELDDVSIIKLLHHLSLTEKVQLKQYIE